MSCSKGITKRALCDPFVAQRVTMSHSAGCLWTPRVLRQTPINAFQQITELRRCDRHNCIGTAAGNARWPDEAAALQPLGKQAHALAIMPQHFHQSTAPSAKHKEMAVMRIALECLLHQQCQAIKALAHVRVAARQPDLHAARNRDHLRRPIFASAPTMTFTIEASHTPMIRIRTPRPNSISMFPESSAGPVSRLAQGQAPPARTSARHAQRHRAAAAIETTG